MIIRRILLLLRRADERRLAEALDTALVAGVFEQTVTVLFSERAADLLIREHPAAILEKISTLEDYGITAVYLCGDTPVDPSQDFEGLRPLAATERSSLIRNQDMVITD